MLLKVCESGAGGGESAAALAPSHSVANAIATPARNQRSKCGGNSTALNRNRSGSPMYDNIDDLLESLRITEENLARRRQPRLYKRTVSDTGLHPLQNIDLILRDCRRPAPISTRIPVPILNGHCMSPRRGSGGTGGMHGGTGGGANLKSKMRICGGANGLPPISPPSSAADVRLRNAAANSHRHDGAADSAYHSSGHSSFCEDADQESSISSTSTRPLSTASGNSSGESGVSEGSETTLRLHSGFQCELQPLPLQQTSSASPPESLISGAADPAPLPSSSAPPSPANSAPSPATSDYMQKVVTEILDTERSYVSDLRDVFEVRKIFPYNFSI